jgi:hypothetical protein
MQWPQDNPLVAAPGSRLPVVVDTHGREVERNVLVMREQTVRRLSSSAALLAALCFCPDRPLARLRGFSTGVQPGA